MKKMLTSMGLLTGLLLFAMTGCGVKNESGSPSVEPVADSDSEIREKVLGVILPRGGISLFAENGQPHRNQGPEAACAEFEDISGDGTGFASAIRGRVLEPLPEHAWYAQLATPVLKDLKAGDVVLLSFWARAEQTGADDGKGEFLIYLGTPGSEGIPPGEAVEPAVYQKAKVGDRWSQFLLPVRLSRDYAKLKTSVNLDFGFALQTLDFAGIELRRYGRLNVEDLPSTFTQPD